ncbi:hypothetical protein PR202_ga28260 [Eleusine coracana subsp. coracana]|uniref:Protein kinase domain-containing protein n=1 Tax=Eleusine coracana subsp. coracana TaxID=191504 RepID=A0AAV5DIC6_ELECO|nr:hypothetical protein PR202_ga28260 [Eleusine coracana subsp. coracana]
MDFKPANILLNDHMVPKVAEFCLSRLDEISQTRSDDRLFSLGYCAPEYQSCGKMSLKLDIYSLGIIIIELMIESKEAPDITKVRLSAVIRILLKIIKLTLSKQIG